MTMNDRLVIAERVPDPDRQQWKPALEATLHELSSGLEVAAQIVGTTGNGFVMIEVHGSDAEVFTELIRRKLRLAPSDLSQVEVHANFKAYATKIDLKRQSIEVEIGPLSTRFRSEITREALIAQLCDGKEIPVDKIARTYCIQEGVPVLVRITSIDPERRSIGTWVSDDQTSRYEEWRRQRFQRIIAVGGFQNELREAMRISRVERDVIAVEELALTAHSLVCKLGTDAPGIIAKIGRHISNFRLYAFLPQQVDRLRFGLAHLRAS